MSHGELRIEPSDEVLSAARTWLKPVREAMNNDFVGAFLTGSVLTQGFSAAKSAVNILVLGRELQPDTLTAIAKAMPAQGRKIKFDPMFLSQFQIEHSLDVFPMEWLDIKERHLRLEGENPFETLEVPRSNLRLQCEHELRGKNIQLRQTYVLSHMNAKALEKELVGVASTFSALFRTLLRLQGESPPANNAHVVERVADVYGLEARGLLTAHLVRYAQGAYKAEEIRTMYLGFMVEVDRLVRAIDELRVA